ncbi:DEAD/DEAH box helicase [Flavisolibacter nicotianae]|uniref:DEAD/DEAH box helicase n=1 Tax=Flavisolibacter nicotianae TaxID=2364882 RepID=UPI000EB1E16F|nr:DEAD/DEAH box helicase [Flavisolibacter nicotianae]
MNRDLTVKKEARVVLLFVPEELLQRFAVLSLLHIKKNDGKIDYTVSGLNRREVQQHFAAIPEAGQSQLLQFQPESLAALQKDVEVRYKKQKAGIPLSVFLPQAMLRHLHQQFKELLPFLAGVKCYHKTRKPGGKFFQTQPCTFQAQKPRLQFEVVKTGNRFLVKNVIVLQEAVSELGAFNRTAFFLEKENEYLLLSYTDYQTLEWLDRNLGEGLEQEAFVAKILSRIEADYTVNRNGLLEEKKVDGLPASRVVFSELNNAFLLLTPQWLYDGILIDGPWRETQEITLKGERVVVERHRGTENQLFAQLSSLHPNFANQHNGYFYLPFAEAQKKQWFIKTYYQLLDSNVEVAGMDLLRHFRYSPHKAETTLTVEKEQGSRVHLRLSVYFGKEAVPLSVLQKAMHAGQRAVVLKDGSLGVLSDEWLENYGTLLKHGTVREGGLQVSKFIALREPESSGAEVGWAPPADASWWEQWRQWQNSEAPLFTLPSTVNATLRPYQQKGFEWLVLLAKLGAGACLADDMGLGKTLQTICFLAWYSEQHPDLQHLIVCPTSLVYNWQNELKKFAPGLRVDVCHGANRQVNGEAQVVITSYGTLRSNSELVLAQAFGIVVIDESHNIKNPSAQITRIVQQLEGKVRIALSGTPVINNTFDLYSQLSFAIPGLLGSREFFKREYADAIDRYGDEAKIKVLQRLTAPFILRRTKEQVATDLPPKTETVMWCTMGPAQEELYHEIKDQIRSHLFRDIQSQGLGKTKLAVLQGMLKLRQICNDPRLLSQEEHGGRLESAKTENLLSEIQRLLGNHKVLVFSQFSSMLQLLAGECDKKGMAYFLLDGRTPAEKRAQMVQDFQENKEAPQLFLISLKAGNAGLTLTAADYVFLFDPWWNTAVEQQAIDRTHRIGQTRNVFSYKLVCRNTIEEKILELQQRKKQLAEELITAEEDFVKNLDEEEIAYLFA